MLFCDDKTRTCMLILHASSVMGSQTSVVPQGGRGTRGAESPRGVGGSGGGGGGGGVDGGGGGNGFGGGIRPNNYVNGGGSLNAIKNMISMQSKRLAEDVNSVYDKQIMYTTKIQFQRSRIEDLTFRIAKAEKELVSFVILPHNTSAGMISQERTTA